MQHASPKSRRTTERSRQPPQVRPHVPTELDAFEHELELSGQPVESAPVCAARLGA